MTDVSPRYECSLGDHVPEVPAPIQAWMEGTPLRLLYTTSINQAEILAGIAVLPEGRRRDEPTDLMIAAIALSRDANVATRNVRDFDGCGVAVINPWDE